MCSHCENVKKLHFLLEHTGIEQRCQLIDEMLVYLAFFFFTIKTIMEMNNIESRMPNDNEKSTIIRFRNR